MSIRKGRKIIAVDFDGTLAVTRYPKIIEPIPKTIQYIKGLQRNGAILILWTCRNGKDLQDAVERCEEQGLIFNYINENTPENIEQYGGTDTRKIYADMYIDDKAENTEKKETYKACIEFLSIWCTMLILTSGLLTILALMATAVIEIIIMIVKGLMESEE